MDAHPSETNLAFAMHPVKPSSTNHSLRKSHRVVKGKRLQGPVRRSARLARKALIGEETTTSKCYLKKKQPRKSLTNSAPEDKPCARTTDKRGAIHYWGKTGYWPREYLEKTEMMNHILARPKSCSSRSKQAGSGSVAPSHVTQSDERERDEKRVTYNSNDYESMLQTYGSFMEDCDLGITDGSEEMYKNLLSTDQPVPADSLFRDDLFQLTWKKLRTRNESRVTRDISLLIVPSAENLATYGANHLEILIESTNEGWNSCIPVTKTRPQPDYSVGFRRMAFSVDQLTKLKPFVPSNCTSFFMATSYIHFPFLTFEANCGAVLEIADRQNAHSMTIAVRAVVELLRLVKREQEVNREILAFSISLGQQYVRIYGHYPVITGEETTFYRHLIQDISLINEGGKNKWTPYKFTKSIYDIWMPMHFERICSAIDEIPDVRDLGTQFSQKSNAPLVPIPEENAIQAGFIGSATPTTSFTRQTENEFKRPRKRK